MLSYPAAVDLSSRTLRYAAGLLHRRLIGSRWQRLPAGRQALLVLVLVLHICAAGTPVPGWSPASGSG